jgi:hypothetical protein
MKLILPTLLLAFSTLASAQFATSVREIDTPAKQAFRLTASCTMASSGLMCPTNWVVPAGFRAVVEQVNVRLNFTNDTAAQAINPAVDIQGNLNGNAVTHNFYPDTKGTTGTSRIFYLRELQRFYMDSFTNFLVVHSSSSPVFVSIGISGHFARVNQN